MKRIYFLRALAAGGLLLSGLTIAVGQSANIGGNSVTEPGTAFATTAAELKATVTWPVVFSSGEATYTVYQPKCDSWDGEHLAARSAVSVQSATDLQPCYGVVTFSAITLVDKTARTAKLVSVQVTGTDFPAARSQGPAYDAWLRQELPNRAGAVTLDRLEMSLNQVNPPSKAGQLDNTPPTIIVATRPAVLVYIDGPPAWRPVAGTSLERVINTRMLLLKNPGGQYYLHLFDGYVQSASLNGPWTVAAHPPAGAKVAEQLATDTGEAELMRGQPDPATQKMPSLNASPLPDVYAATRPTELITFMGQPSTLRFQAPACCTWKTPPETCSNPLVISSIIF